MAKKRRERRGAAQDLSRKDQLESQLWTVILEGIASRQDQNAWVVIPIPRELRKELAELWRKLDRARETD
jgi:hypothetical protein